jgi:hypothetical protein
MNGKRYVAVTLHCKTMGGVRISASLITSSVMGQAVFAARSRLRHINVLVTCALTLFVPSDVRGDSWAGARIRESFSESREYFVRVIPGESVGDVVGFAGSKKGKYARAEFYRRAKDRSYKLIAETTLGNPVAPVEFFVSDGGRLVTVDNWHNLGYGNVVSIYDSKASLNRTYELRDLFLAEEIQAFPHSVSSIHWRNGPVYIRQDQKTLLITVRSGADFLFGLESGKYQYCENQENTYRCRHANQPREWMPNSKLQVTR